MCAGKDLKILFLGTGTSTGIPQIGCKCGVCTDTDLRNKRLRASVYLIHGDDKVLIDCGPDFREQMLRYSLDDISAILLTHEHYDHISGLDDVRPLGDMNIYAESRVLDTIRSTMPYCFESYLYPGVPLLKLNKIDETVFKIGKTIVEPIRVMHYKLPILGFKINNFAYLTDVKSISDESIIKLQNLDTLIINALRQKEHISHFNLEQAIEAALKINAKNTFFTHISHDMGIHQEIEKTLPPNIHLAYDGLEIKIF
jgi:phosphoribosyl 1,2-cyclic phosphate phosphodiesterase